MRYLVMEYERCFDDYEEAIRFCLEDNYHEDDVYFEEWVNEMYGSIEINGESYYAFNILDSMASGELDYLREEYCERENANDYDNAEYELRNGDIGDIISVQHCNIEIMAEETEPTDDSNGDENLEYVRKFIEEQKVIEESTKQEQLKDEDELMKMFQVIA